MKNELLRNSPPNPGRSRVSYPLRTDRMISVTFDAAVCGGIGLCGIGEGRGVLWVG